MSGYRLKPAGDTALIVEFGDEIDRDVSDAVLALAHDLQAASIEGVIEIAPTFRSLAVYYEPLRVPCAELSQTIERLLTRSRKRAGSTE